MSNAGERLCAYLDAVSGIKRLLLGFLFGCCGALAMAPLYLLPLFVLSLCGLILMLRSHSSGRRSRRSAFWLGWAHGFGFFAVGLYWIMLAFLVQAEQFGPFAPFALIGLASGLAIFSGLLAVAVSHARAGSVAQILAVATAWAALEWLRGTILTGFPWNLAAYVWADVFVVAQAVSVIGSYGLSFITVFLAGLPVLFIIRDSGDERSRRVALLAGVGTFAVLVAFGGWRLVDAEYSVIKGVTLRLVQPNIDQRDKWRRDLRDRNLGRYVEMSRGDGFEKVTHVIWPETAAAFPLALDPSRLKAVATAVPNGGVLLTGAPRLSVDAAGETRIWNSMHAIDAAGRVVATYDKFHLVPFGEYMPLRSIIPFPKLTAGRKDFSSGPGLRTMALAGLPPAAALICYEIIFPGHVVAGEGPRPEWMLNMTNDAWFGKSTGPHQHFDSARMRAIEEGLPLVRAANTGISAVVDPYGRVLGSIPLGETGVLDSPLPKSLPPTVFASAGNLMLVPFLIFGVLAWIPRGGRDVINDGAND